MISHYYIYFSFEIAIRCSFQIMFQIMSWLKNYVMQSYKGHEIKGSPCYLLYLQTSKYLTRLFFNNKNHSVSLFFLQFLTFLKFKNLKTQIEVKSTSKVNQFRPQIRQNRAQYLHNCSQFKVKLNYTLDQCLPRYRDLETFLRGLGEN